MSRLSASVLLVAIIAYQCTAEGEPSTLAGSAASILQSARDGTAPAGKSAFPDTFVLYGGPGTLHGKFESAGGAPDWQGWEPHDLTDVPNYWQISTFNAANLGEHGAGNHAYWCGRTAEQRPNWVDPPGYGPNWDTAIWYESEPVADPSAPQDVSIDFLFNYETEPAYDAILVEAERSGQWESLHGFYEFSGTNHDGYGIFAPPGVRFSESVGNVVNYLGGDYGGDDGDRIRLRIRFVSDGAFDDENGLWPTYAGAAQVDDLSITHLGGSFFEDFEGPGPYLMEQQGKPFVGDFAEIFPRVTDLDPFRENESPVAAFIDYGQAVRNGPDPFGNISTGGMTSPAWDYGIPGGYVVNHEGGLSAGPDALALNNEIWSPQIEWDLPGTADDDPTVRGALLEFDYYGHLPVSNGIFLYWKIGPGQLYQTRWTGDNILYFNPDGPRWDRLQVDLSSYLSIPPGSQLRVALGVMDAAAVFGLPGNDATPAPFVDNVRLLKYRLGGPRMITDERRLPQAGFPVLGIDPSTQLLRDTMDVLLRSQTGLNVINMDVWDHIEGGSVFDVQLVWALKKNPLFEDAIRVVPATGQDQNVVTGPEVWTGERLVDGLSTVRRGFDSPIPGAFYPGDQFEFYFRATDNQGRTTTLPADLNGFAAFDGSYDSRFATRALPSFFDASGAHPAILAYVAGGERVDADLIRLSFAQLGMHEGADYDLFYASTNSDFMTLGARTAATQLQGYETILCFSGGGGDYAHTDPYYTGIPDYLKDMVGLDDGTLTLLHAWLDQPGHRNLVHFGSYVAYSLATGGGTGLDHLQTRLGLDLIDPDGWAEVGGGVWATVSPLEGVFDTQFVVGGGADLFAAVEHVEARSGSLASHRFEMPGGGQHPSAAASVFVGQVVDGYNKLRMMFPFAFRFVQDGQEKQAGLPARARLLKELLEFFGAPASTGPATAIPNAPQTSLSVAPNPFNPQTTIELRLERDGFVRVDVYNMRGQLVRRLIRGDRPAGVHRFRWDGTDDRGAALASGSYIVRAAAAKLQLEEKVLLLK